MPTMEVLPSPPLPSPLSSSSLFFPYLFRLGHEEFELHNVEVEASTKTGKFEDSMEAYLQAKTLTKENRTTL